jgi:hypothetical protein
MREGRQDDHKWSRPRPYEECEECHYADSLPS